LWDAECPGVDAMVDLLRMSGRRYQVQIQYAGAMAMTVEELASLAMSLPREARAQLLDLLAQSLDADEPGPFDEAWLDEARRRRDDVRSGRVQSIPGEEALRRVRDSLPR
jgi:putative addiction module component (TIGR02574 family)